MGKIDSRIAPSLRIWWTKHKRVNGRVSEHLSPYQTRIMAPVLRDVAGKTMARFTDNWVVAGIPIGAALFGASFADSGYMSEWRGEWP